MQFNELGISPAILRALSELGYKTPSPIQEGAIPPALEGRDILGLAQTGTGKTCAFAVPILQYLQKKQPKGKRAPTALIVTPTRELALQIDESFQNYGKNLNFIKHTVIFGGVGQNPQVQALRRSVDILTATPGRLLDLHGQGHLDLTAIDILVLDEADRMLDMGFFPDVKRILAQLPHEKQTMLFSATMPKEVSEVANSLLKNPVTVQVAPVSSPVEVIEQKLYYVDKGNKSRLLVSLIKEQGIQSALVFARTKHGANKVAADLEKAGISAAAIHGNKSQTARVAALAGFKKGEIRALVATDIAARGIDIDQLSHVFNYNLPEVPETYVHRIGRTGRAGHEGTAVSFCDVDEKSYLKDIEKLMGRKIEVVEEHAFPMMNTTPTPTRNGRRVNPEDEEARQAARERRAAKQAAQQGQKQAKAPAAVKTEPKQAKPAQKKKSSAPSPAVQQKKQTQSAAVPKEVQQVRKLSNHFATPPQAIKGERIMDATARMLAPKKTLEYSKQEAKKPQQKRAQPQKPQEQGAKQKRKAQPPKQQSAKKQPLKDDPKRAVPRVVGGQRPRRTYSQPMRQPDPKPEHSGEFKSFYISFDD